MAVVTGRQDGGERLGTASQRPSLSRHLRLNFRNTGVQPAARPQAGQTNPQTYTEEDGIRPGVGKSEDKPRTITPPDELTQSHERQRQTQTHWPPTLRRTSNRESEVGEILRGPTQKKVEEAPLHAEEVEAQKLKAEDAHAEHHEAVRQLKERQTPDEEGYPEHNWSSSVSSWWAHPLPGTYDSRQ